VAHLNLFRATPKNPLFFKRSKNRQFRKTRLTLAGCGQVGQVLLNQAPHLHINATYRNFSDRTIAIRQFGAKTFFIDLHQKQALKRLAALGSKVIWLAPPNPSTPNDKTLIYFTLLLGLHAKRYGLPKPTLSYISTTGVYGNTNGEWVNERSRVNPQSDRAKRRIQAETQLRYSYQQSRINLHLLRAPGIYSESRLPIERIKKGAPALLEQDDSWSNHIHELDLARLSLHCNLKRAPYLLINACDSQPQKMGHYFDAVADTFGLKRPPRLAKKDIQARVSSAMWSFMSESRKIKSVRMKKIGFVLKYPSIQLFFEHFTLNKVVEL
jgi:nucleoside-diphosphate-sugar epimerase